MSKFNVKELKAIAIAIIAIMIICCIFMMMYSESNPLNNTDIIQKVEYSNNNSKIIISDKKIFCNTKMFIEDTWKSAIIEVPLVKGSGEETRIIASNYYGSNNQKMYVDDIGLYYEMDGNTYRVDKSTGENRRIAEGSLQILPQNNSYVTLYRKNLYKGELYPVTQRTKKITKINEESYTFLGKDENGCYYASELRNNYTVISKIDNDLNITPIDYVPVKSSSIEGFLIDNSRIVELIKEGSTYMLRIVSNSKKDSYNIDAETIDLSQFSYLEIISKENYKDESIDTNGKNNSSQDDELDKIYLFVGDKERDETSTMVKYNVVNKRVYEYKFGDDKIVISNDKLGKNFKDNYSIKYDEEKIKVYLHNEELFSIVPEFTENTDTNVESTIDSTNYINGEYYVEFTCETDNEISIYLVKYNEETKELRVLNR